MDKFSSFPPLPLSVIGDTVTCATYSHFAGKRSLFVCSASGHLVCLNASEMDENFHCAFLWSKRFPQPVLSVRTSYFTGDGRGDLVVTTSTGIHITHLETQSAIETVEKRLMLMLRLANLLKE